MRAEPTVQYHRALMKMPTMVREAAYKQVDKLVQNLRHPSLRAKKYDEAHDIWQARVTDTYRFYFVIQGDTYVLLDITKHPK